VLKTNPAAIPGIVTTFGRIRWRRSITNRTIIAQANRSRTARSGVQP
jgi:hypothetical protein